MSWSGRRLLDVTALKKGSGKPAQCSGMGTYLIDASGYLRRTRTPEGYLGYSCIGKLFGDIFEKLVMVIFDDMRWYESHGRWHKGHWYEIPSGRLCR